jgi:2,4-dienoyl-CoA reductase (NADPH2)
MVADYRTASEVCCEAGFDGIEIHGANGNLLNRFLSSTGNTRTDTYGVNLDNRMRLAIEIARSSRSGCGEGMLLLYRHSPVREGYTLEDSVALGTSLVQSGVDILHIVPASVAKPGDIALQFRQMGVPVIAARDMDHLPSALEVLSNNRADMVAIGRGLIADPDWPIKVQSGRTDEIIRCTRCEEGCFSKGSNGTVIGCRNWT